MRTAVWSAVVAAGLAASPILVMGQYDPTLNPNPGSLNPQAPQNQNIPINQPGFPTQTGGTQAPMNTSMRDSLGAPGLTGQQMRDQRFVANATEAGIGDIQISRLALQKGSAGVKDLAQKMIDDHTGINKDLSGVADSIGMILPRKMGKEQQAEYDKLNKMSDKEFDAEYVTFMARSHFQDLHVFHMEAAAASDTDLQQEVVKAMRTMHDHLGLIRDTAKNQSITLPEPPQRGRRNNAATASR